MRTASEVVRSLEQRIARLERQSSILGKTCVIEKMYRGGREGERGEAVLNCNGVKLSIKFDLYGYSTVIGNDQHLESTGALGLLDNLKMEYGVPKIKEFIAKCIAIAGREGMTLDECIKIAR